MSCPRLYTGATCVMMHLKMPRVIMPVIQESMVHRCRQNLWCRLRMEVSAKFQPGSAPFADFSFR